MGGSTESVSNLHRHNNNRGGRNTRGANERIELPPNPESRQARGARKSLRALHAKSKISIEKDTRSNVEYVSSCYL
jgi:RNA 3'-terminal phosphate cyclase